MLNELKPKRIGIFVNSGWNLVNFRRELMESLVQGGFELHIIVPEDYPGLDRYGVVHPLELNPGGKNPFQDLRTIRNVYRLLKTLDLDCLLTFTIKSNIYGAFIASILGTRVICNITGLGETFTHRGLIRRMVRVAYRMALRRAELVFVQNRDDQLMLLEKGFADSRKLQRLPGSGVDPWHFQPMKMEANPKGPRCTFLFVGRFRYDKGFKEYLHAAKIVSAANPGVCFRAVGRFEENRSTCLTPGEVEQLSEGAVEIIPFTDDVRPVIAGADCVVLPSYREGLPRSLLEASSMGKPLIAADTPGCRDVVVHEKTGFLCEVKSVPSLVAAMQKIVDFSPEQRIKMGSEGRKWVVDHFNVRHVVDAYLREIGLLTNQSDRCISSVSQELLEVK